MARPITTRRVQNMLRQKLLPGQMAEPSLAFFTRPEGEDHITNLQDIGLNKSPFVENFVFDTAGAYVVRNGTETVGAVAGSAICGTVVFSSRTGGDYIVRVTTTGVQMWAGSSWIDLTGPALALAQDTAVEFTVWNNDLLFTDLSTGLYTISLSSGTYSKIPGAAVSKHITTFGGRVIASYVILDADPSLSGSFPTRIEWCVKNDNTDWLGLGSGYEDLLSAPGGTVDIQHGVIPVTDVEAFVVRSSSIWIMNTTGYFDTPFQFTYRFDQGTDSPGSVVRVPVGRGDPKSSLYAQIMMLGVDDVVSVRPEGITPVGLPIRDQLLGGTLNPRKAIAGFEGRMREYWIHVPPLNGLNTTSVVWRYRVDEHAWYHTKYPFKIEKMAFKDLLFAQTYDDLTGTFDSQTSTFDNWGLGARQPSVIFAVSSQNRTLRERTGVVGDVDGLGVAQGIAVEIQTGLVVPSSPLDDLTLIMVELLYEASQQVVANFDYSVDGGTTWVAYGQLTLAVTTGPTTVPYRYTLHVPRCQLRVTSTDGSTLALQGLYVKVVKGSPINQ